MTESSRRFIHRPLGISILAVAHLCLGALCMYFLMAYGLMEGFWESLALGFGMLAVGAGSTGVLTHLNRRLRWLWIGTFSVLPFIYILPSYMRYVTIGDSLPLAYWILYPIALVCACMIGSLLGEGFELWNRLRKPTRGNLIRKVTRWLS